MTKKDSKTTMSEKKLAVQWTAGMEDEQAVAFRKQVKGSKDVLDQLSRIIQMHANSVAIKERSPEAFTDPNWSHKQAWANGHMNALELIGQLINV